MVYSTMSKNTFDTNNLPYIDMAASSNQVVQSGMYFNRREAYEVIY